MKKVYLFIICFILFATNSSAKKTKVTLDKCVDGDTVVIIINDIKTKVRFLAVDSPEIDTEEPYSIEARDFTCNMLTNSKEIYLEFDNKADEHDKYDRMLAWVWADNTLVQQELVKNGLARIAYLYDNYKYASELKNFEIYAKDNKLGIWSDETYVKKYQDSKKIKGKKEEKFIDKIEKYYSLIAIILCMILALLTYYRKYKKTK